MKTRRNLYIEDDLWELVKQRALSDSRSASAQIVAYIKQGLTGELPPDHAELVGLLIEEVRAAWKLQNGMYSDVDPVRLKELIEEFTVRKK